MAYTCKENTEHFVTPFGGDKAPYSRLVITKSLGLSKLPLDMLEERCYTEDSKTKKHKAEMRFRTLESTLYKQSLFIACSL